MAIAMLHEASERRRLYRVGERITSGCGVSTNSSLDAVPMFNLEMNSLTRVGCARVRYASASAVSPSSLELVLGCAKFSCQLFIKFFCLVVKLSLSDDVFTIGSSMSASPKDPPVRVEAVSERLRRRLFRPDIEGCKCFVCSFIGRLGFSLSVMCIGVERFFVMGAVPSIEPLVDRAAALWSVLDWGDCILI